VLLLAGFAWLSAMVSCMGPSSRPLLLPATIPGATFVGSGQCTQCHANVTRVFHDATHANLGAIDGGDKDVSCEACHGPASLHVKTGGESGTILNPRQSVQACFRCHLDKQGEFSLPHSHPVLAGKMSCVDCHDPHSGDAVAGSGAQLTTLNDTCVKCHNPQRGPFVFEHEAVREGCVTCHNPHGSVNEKLLKVRNQALCLQCHFQEQTGPGVLLIGGIDHRPFISRGTCWSAGCHEAVHGSHANSSLRY
jgi:predicted CXXCH cytochrome family protein